MTCEKCQKAIADDEPRVDVKEVSEKVVKRYHAACAATVIAPQAVASTSAAVASTSAANGSSQEG